MFFRRLRNVRFVFPQSRSLTSLCEKHAFFLDQVKHQGEGTITLKVDDLGGPYSNNRAGLLAEIIISNPPKKNAISGRMMYELANIVDEITTVKCSVLGLIIRGEGDIFCSGADFTLVKDIVNTPEKGMLMSRFMTDTLSTLRTSKIISVCALNGSALGGGAELATVSDFRVMKSGAFIQFVHATIGASPGWGGSTRLSSIVGRRNALKIIGASERVTAPVAVSIGLVDELTAANEEITDCAKSLLKPYLSQTYPASVASIKASIAAHETSTDYAKEVELNAFYERWYCQDNVEALKKK